jgi:hypothetical protein
MNILQSLKRNFLGNVKSRFLPQRSAWKLINQYVLCPQFVDSRGCTDLEGQSQALFLQDSGPRSDWSRISEIDMFIL